MYKTIIAIELIIILALATHENKQEMQEYCQEEIIEATIAERI